MTDIEKLNAQLSEAAWYSTPAAIRAFCDAEIDRALWLEGRASEQHLHEPSKNREVTALRRVRWLTSYEAGYVDGLKARQLPPPWVLS